MGACSRLNGAHYLSFNLVYFLLEYIYIKGNSINVKDIGSNQPKFSGKWKSMSLFINP